MKTFHEMKYGTNDSALFQKEKIDAIEDTLESNLEILFNVNEYAEISKNFSELNLELLSSLDENQRSLFHTYQNISLSLNTYQNALAYYLGANTKEK